MLKSLKPLYPAINVRRDFYEQPETKYIILYARARVWRDRQVDRQTFYLFWCMNILTILRVRNVNYYQILFSAPGMVGIPLLSINFVIKLFHSLYFSPSVLYCTFAAHKFFTGMFSLILRKCSSPAQLFFFNTFSFSTLLLSMYFVFDLSLSILSLCAGTFLELLYFTTHCL